MSHRVLAFVGGGLGRHAVALLARHGWLAGAVLSEGCDYRHGPMLDNPWGSGWKVWTHTEAEAALASGATHGLSAGYRHRIPSTVHRAIPVANVHTSLLPLCRGAHPNAWAIFSGHARAGATLHVVDDGIDTGPILAQVEVPIRGTDTAGTLYPRLQEAAESLLDWAVPAWLAGQLAPREQGSTAWPTRRRADLETLRVDGDKKYQGWEVMNILRARSFPGYPGALYTAPDGRQYRVRVELEDA